MKRRMDKYSLENKRVDVNNSLYDDVKKEDIAETIDLKNTDEIDLTELKKPSKREKYQKIKHYEEVLKQGAEEEFEEIKEKEEIEEKLYDINEILKRHEEERKALNKDERHDKIKDTQFDILSKLDIGKSEEEESLEMELFGDLVARGDTEVIRPVEKTMTEELSLESDIRNNKTEEIDITNEMSVKKEVIDKDIEEEIDQSFYTSSMKINKEDFDKFTDVESTFKFNSVLIKILIAVIFVIVAGIIYYVIKTYM